MNTESHHHSGHDHSALIQKLLDCVVKCEACASACLHEEHVGMMIHCIELDRDCADVCTLTAKLLERNSEIAHKILVICAEICQRCADECKSHAHEHCLACASACEDCAQACNQHINTVGQDMAVI